MGTYDITKNTIKNANIFGSDLMIELFSSFTAGFFLSVTVCPFDVVRTRMMNQPVD